MIYSVSVHAWWQRLQSGSPDLTGPQPPAPTHKRLNRTRAEHHASVRSFVRTHLRLSTSANQAQRLDSGTLYAVSVEFFNHDTGRSPSIGHRWHELRRVSRNGLVT